MAGDNGWKPQDDEIDDEEEEELEGAQYTSMKDAILFAIHVSPSMLSTHEDNWNDADDDNNNNNDEDPKKKKKKSKAKPVSAVMTALRCAYDILQQRIISNPNDMMGILLLGTEETRFPDGNSYKHCYLLLDLDVPDAAGVKELKTLIDDEDEFNRLMVPSKEPVSMSNVLFGANQIFTTKAANFQSRRLFIVTDDDDPHAKDKTMKNAAITRARDLYDLGVRIDPFYISNPGKPEFDPSKFYEDIIYRSPEDEEEDTTALHLKPTLDGKLRLQEMKSSIRSKATPKRALFTSKLEIGPGFEIGVKGYILYKKQEKARSHYVYMGSEQPQIVKGITTQMAEETARTVEKTEVRKAYKFGGEQVLFTPEEMKEIRNFGPPTTRIIGFKPMSSLRFADNVKPANFIYPSEAEVVGSTRTFAALHKKLLDSDKFALAWHIPRRNAAPTLAALIPSEEKLDGRAQIHPPGLFIIQLPWANDIRQNPDVLTNKAPDTLVDMMRTVIKQLHMPKGYIPEKYSNPSLQWHYRILQAIALDEDIPEQPEDNTLPKYKLIHKHAGAHVIKWGEELEHICSSMPPSQSKIKMESSSSSKPRKRTAAVKDEEEDQDSAPAKKTKTTTTLPVEGLTDKDMQMAYRKGTLQKFTVANLKGWLSGKRLDTGGKKADLIDRVEGYFEKK